MHCCILNTFNTEIHMKAWLNWWISIIIVGFNIVSLWYGSRECVLFGTKEQRATLCKIGKWAGSRQIVLEGAQKYYKKEHGAEERSKKELGAKEKF